MKTIKGRLLATVSAAAFIVLFIGAAAGATVVGSAGIGSAVGAGLLTGVLGTVVIDAAVSSVLGSALQPIAELKQFASGDFSEQSRMEAGTGWGDGVPGRSRRGVPGSQDHQAADPGDDQRDKRGSGEHRRYGIRRLQ